MICEAARAAMDQEFAGETEGGQPTVLRAHLATCADCTGRYERLARVDSVLAQGGLSVPRMELLEARILARVAPSPAPALKPAPWLRSRVWAAALVAATLALVVAVPAYRASQENEFTPRGAASAAWGARAFCVGPDARVSSEAHAGETLRCPQGSVVQFTYTAPQEAHLAISLDRGGDRLFPAEAERTGVKPGVDVALPSSTPVGAWLSEPQQVTVRFTDESGAVISQSTLTIAP